MNSIQTKRYKSPTSWEVWGWVCGLVGFEKQGKGLPVTDDKDK